MKTSFALSALLFAAFGSLLVVDCGGSAVSDGGSGAAGELSNAGAGSTNAGAGPASAGASSAGGQASGNAGNSATGGVAGDAGSGAGAWDVGAAGEYSTAGATSGGASFAGASFAGASAGGASSGGSGGNHVGGGGSGGAAAGAGGEPSTWFCYQGTAPGDGDSCDCVLEPYLPNPGEITNKCTMPLAPCCFTWSPLRNGKITACQCHTEKNFSCTTQVSAIHGTKVDQCPP